MTFSELCNNDNQLIEDIQYYKSINAHDPIPINKDIHKPFELNTTVYYSNSGDDKVRIIGYRPKGKVIGELHYMGDLFWNAVIYHDLDTNIWVRIDGPDGLEEFFMWLNKLYVDKKS